MSPWLDLRVPPKDGEDYGASGGADASSLPGIRICLWMPWSFPPQADCLFEIGRNRRYVVLRSLYHHHVTANDQWYRALNDTPGLVGPPIEPPPASSGNTIMTGWDKDGYPFCSGPFGRILSPGGPFSTCRMCV